jgi:uroporphyrinogen decarboxylase
MGLQKKVQDQFFPWLWIGGGTGAGKDPDGVLKYADEWGTVWRLEAVGPNARGYPLEAGYHLLDDYALPEPGDPKRWGLADAQMKSNRDKKYMRGMVWFTLFERLWMLRGLENMLTDPYLNYDEFCELRDKIVDYNLKLIDMWIERDVDGIFFSDDWGWQQGLFMRPDDWRKFYKPSYERMFSKVKQAGKHVWLHSCGNVIDLLDDFMELGLDVLDPIQPQALDLDELARRYKGKLCFHGGIDVQGVMVRGGPDEVKDFIRMLAEKLGDPSGGYIMSTSHSIMPETRLENVAAIYEAYLELL